jgi:hypothetical protein
VLKCVVADRDGDDCRRAVEGVKGVADFGDVVEQTGLCVCLAGLVANAIGCRSCAIKACVLAAATRVSARCA